MNKIILTYFFIIFPFFVLFAQEPDVIPKLKDTTFTPMYDVLVLDSADIDSMQMEGRIDTTNSEPVLDAPIKYDAEDSMIVSLDGQKVFLYNNAQVTYQNINLTAYYIELDLETKEIFATGLIDSTGEMTQKPIFKQGSEEYESETMRYNFKSEKAFITKVVSQQGEGYIHSDRTKKIGEEVFITEDAKYTTCDADHPHFYLQLTKAKVISNKKIITGPAYMVLEDFPIYFPILPFGYFPNNPTYSSGILIPKYGEEVNRGFFLRDGGYYWAASQYFDLAVQGDIYSKGSWGARIKTNYKVRYKFSGNFGFDYAINVYGEKGMDTYRRSKQYKVTWSHSQDAKANPNQTFSASVNLSSSGYDKQNANNINDYLTTTKSSSISYTRRFENTPFNISANLRHSQNTRDTTISLSLPELTFSMAKVYPFRRKNPSGKLRFYEKLGFTYTGNFRNTIDTKEYLLLESSFSKDWRNGIKHSLPLAFPSFNLFKYINFSPGIGYNEKWYFKKYNYEYVPDGNFQNNPSGVPSTVRVDTISGLNRVYDYSYSISSSTTIYGMFRPRNPNSKINAIRHTIRPTISFSYTPNFGDPRFGYYQNVQVNDSTYRYFDVNAGGIYGGSPGTGGGKQSASISFGITNNLEMKVLDTKDSTKTDAEQKYRKVKLIDNLGISSSYDFIADSFKLRPFAIQARTTVAGVNVNMSTTLDPYTVNENYVRINKFAWNEKKGLARLGRITQASLSFGMNFKSKNKNNKSGQGKGSGQEQGGGRPADPMPGTGDEEEVPVLPSAYDNYMDFSMPWDLSFDYSFNYTGKTLSKPKGMVRQAISVRGNLSITEKWKMSANTNFDIMEGEFALTTFNLTRDLHCWSMSFNFIPFGYRKSYSFTIAAKSSMLQDLKLQKQQSHYDNF
ncbi:MAG TPA: putative LPS assembly protein LptD [Draconibacterium sp.]|nr:putative LPS assembly protein LptD [Draconibacterium sp.]